MPVSFEALGMVPAQRPEYEQATLFLDTIVLCTIRSLWFMRMVRSL